MEHLTNVKDWEKLLDETITISQKIDGSALIARFEKGKIRYFGREARKEIDIVHRVTTDIYNAGIDYLELVLPKVLKSEGQEIAFEYFPPKIKPVVPIIRRPKNNLVLLYTKNVSVSAQQIGVEPQPIIFHGKLNTVQKEALMSGEMNARILKILNPSFQPIINPDSIEGIVISTSRGLYKITNKLFQDLIKQKKINASDSDAEKYKKLLIGLCLGFSFTVPTGYKYTPENYLKVIFDNIEAKQAEIIRNFGPTFAEFKDGAPYQVDFTDFSWNLVPQALQANMKKYPWFKDFVRLLISNYRKQRSRAFPGVDKETMKIFNDKVKALLVETRLYRFLLTRNIV